MSLPFYDVHVSRQSAILAHVPQPGTREVPPRRPRSFCASDHLRVLVVDDAAINRELPPRLLQTPRHKVDRAEHALKAIEKVKEAMQSGSPYDTILMNDETSNMNGPAAIRAIRDMQSDAFIVGVTGNMFPEDIHRADRVLAKPISHQGLDARMDSRNAGNQHYAVVVPKGI